MQDEKAAPKTPKEKAENAKNRGNARFKKRKYVLACLCDVTWHDIVCLYYVFILLSAHGYFLHNSHDIVLTSS